MKNLIIIRHAKSDWNNPSLKDKERPLNKRGKKDAPMIGQIMKKAEVIPDVILTSDAERAFTTAKMLAYAFLPQEVSIEKVSDFYLGNIASFNRVIVDLDDSVETVFLVGHNPALESYIEYLVSDSSFSVKLPTAGAVSIELSVNRWKDIDQSTGEFRWMIIPKFMKKILT